MMMAGPALMLMHIQTAARALLDGGDPVREIEVHSLEFPRQCPYA